MAVRSDRILLALQVAFGVLPITIIGGGYSLLGLVSGSVWVVMSIRALTFDAVGWWLTVLALAAGGLWGIAGLWSMILISASSARPTPSMIRLALGGSGVGVITAVSALVLLFSGGPFDRLRTAAVYVLLSPIAVVLHRAPAIARHR